MSQDLEIEDAPDRNRFEVEVEGRTAVVDYRLEDGTLRLIHTGVPPEFEGRGIGSSLARHALESARRRGLRIWPDCPFITAYIRKHQEYLDLVDPSFPNMDRLRRRAKP